MTTEAWLHLALGALVTAFMSLGGVALVGLYVVRKYPAMYDPARNAQRYTLPVVILLVLSAACVAIFALALIAAGVTALAT